MLCKFRLWKRHGDVFTMWKCHVTHVIFAFSHHASASARDDCLLLGIFSAEGCKHLQFWEVWRSGAQTRPPELTPGLKNMCTYLGIFGTAGPSGCKYQWLQVLPRFVETRASHNHHLLSTLQASGHLHPQTNPCWCHWVAVARLRGWVSHESGPSTVDSLDGVPCWAMLGHAWIPSMQEPTGSKQIHVPSSQFEHG